jgi:hypothetical protein
MVDAHVAVEIRRLDGLGVNGGLCENEQQRAKNEGGPSGSHALLGELEVFSGIRQG